MKVYLRTFGCRANRYDSETVRAMVHASGGTIVAEPELAEIAVFTSCAVTADAEADLRQHVRRAARRNPAIRSVITGCAAALATPAGSTGSRALHALPAVSHVIGGADAAAIAGALELPSAAAAVVAARQSGARAVLRIQDGCDECCTFCATTQARGANRSRAIAALVEEARALADAHAEIVLTGIHIGTYGVDTGTSLGALLEALVRDVPAVRFRLSSVEASEVDDRLRALLGARDGRVAPYLHAPLQSGSDRVLRRMGRHWYTASAYAAAVERILAGASVFGLGADIIAGFPGETDEDHAATLALVAGLPFTALHIFPYSARPGTAATRLPAPVEPATIARRAAELRTAARLKVVAYRARRDGGLADVVVTGESARRAGVTEDFLTVIPSDPLLPRGARVAARLHLRGEELVARVPPM